MCVDKEDVIRQLSGVDIKLYYIKVISFFFVKNASIAINSLVEANETARVVEHIPDWSLMSRNTQPYNPPALPAGLSDRIYR